MKSGFLLKAFIMLPVTISLFFLSTDGADASCQDNPWACSTTCRPGYEVNCEDSRSYFLISICDASNPDVLTPIDVIYQEPCTGETANAKTNYCNVIASDDIVGEVFLGKLATYCESFGAVAVASSNGICPSCNVKLMCSFDKELSSLPGEAQIQSSVSSFGGVWDGSSGVGVRFGSVYGCVPDQTACSEDYTYATKTLGIECPAEISGIKTIVVRVITMIWAILGLVVLVTIVRGGVMIMTAGGEPEKRAKGMKLVTTAGFAFIGVGVLYFLLVFGATWLGLGDRSQTGVYYTFVEGNRIIFDFMLP